MEDPSRTVTRLISQACSQYPGGLRAVVNLIRQHDGDRPRSESTLYADFNPNPTSTGKLKVRDLMQAMEITGNHGVLRYMAAHFGYSLTSLTSVEPDAPTLEGEMLQDYPAVVAFHEAIQASGTAKWSTRLCSHVLRGRCWICAKLRRWSVPMKRVRWRDDDMQTRRPCCHRPQQIRRCRRRPA